MGIIRKRKTKKQEFRESNNNDGKEKLRFLCRKRSRASLQLHLTVLSAPALTYMHVGPFLPFSSLIGKDIRKPEGCPSLTPNCHI
jgi:hypothetical protein